MENIEVTITLADGRSHSAVLAADADLLSELHIALLSTDHVGSTVPCKLLQFPIEGGTSACSFASSSLVSVVTSPPVLIQPIAPNLASELPDASQSTLGSHSNVSPCYVKIDDFLTPEENHQVFQYALENEADFEGSTVIQNGERGSHHEKRRSRVLHAIGGSKWKTLFYERLMLHLPHVQETLGIEKFDIDHCEIQLTASNDGDFFVGHSDSDPYNREVATRQMTFVYYFHKSPKPYSGGNLLIYDNEHGLGSVTSIPPVNNSMVIFASERWHEVDIVRSESQLFSDSRFTVNGWLRRPNVYTPAPED